MTKEEKYYHDKLVGNLIRVDCVDEQGKYIGNNGYQKITDFLIENEGEENYENYVLVTERILQNGTVSCELTLEPPYQDSTDELLENKWVYARVKHGEYTGRKSIVLMF